MSIERLPAVTFKNTIQKKQIAHRMYYHRKKMIELQSKRPKLSVEAHHDNYKTILEDNPKRQYFIQSKYTQIERENRLLFEKISKISLTKKKEPRSLQRIKSLNITFRKKQIEQIQNENTRIYGRLLKQKPFISFKDTDKEFVKTRRMADMLSKRQKYRLEEWY